MSNKIAIAQLFDIMNFATMFFGIVVIPRFPIHSTAVLPAPRKNCFFFSHQPSLSKFLFGEQGFHAKRYFVPLFPRIFRQNPRPESGPDPKNPLFFRPKALFAAGSRYPSDCSSNGHFDKGEYFEKISGQFSCPCRASEKPSPKQRFRQHSNPRRQTFRSCIRFLCVYNCIKPVREKGELQKSRYTEGKGEYVLRDSSSNSDRCPSHCPG